MRYLIVTNNPLIKKESDKVYFVKGDYEDVLVKVRDLVYEGVELVSHPLGASMRMLFSPYRSIVLGKKNSLIDFFHIETIESSIINYRKSLEFREVDWVHADDYALLDNELLKSALKDLEVDFNNDI